MKGGAPVWSAPFLLSSKLDQAAFNCGITIWIQPRASR